MCSYCCVTNDHKCNDLRQYPLFSSLSFCRSEVQIHKAEVLKSKLSARPHSCIPFRNSEDRISSQTYPGCQVNLASQDWRTESPLDKSLLCSEPFVRRSPVSFKGPLNSVSPTENNLLLLKSINQDLNSISTKLLYLEWCLCD